MWLFDEGKGDVTADTTANKNGGTLMNKGLKASLNPSAVELSGKLVSTWAALRK
jgi:hypothetical protein